MSETVAQRTKRLEMRDRYRETVCKGCRHNYYNWPKPRSDRGDVAVPDDCSCWNVDKIKNGKCPAYSR